MSPGGHQQTAKKAADAYQRRGHSMNRFRYYRHAQLGVFAAAYAAFGVELSRREVREIRLLDDEVAFFIAWD